MNQTSIDQVAELCDRMEQRLGALIDKTGQQLDRMHATIEATMQQTMSLVEQTLDLVEQIENITKHNLQQQDTIHDQNNL
jgi:hypothetical protein